MDILYIILYEYYGRQNTGCSKSCLWLQSPELGEYANLMRHGTMRLGLRPCDGETVLTTRVDPCNSQILQLRTTFLPVV